MLSLWQLATGTRTQVGQTWIESSPRIFRVSWTIFISSEVYPWCFGEPIWGMQLKAMR